MHEEKKKLCHIVVTEGTGVSGMANQAEDINNI